MTWKAAKHEIERRALARLARDRDLSLPDAVRLVLQASPRLWKAYQHAIAEGERQEFLSERPHRKIVITPMEEQGRAMVATSAKPMTLRDAVLEVLRNSKS